MKTKLLSLIFIFLFLGHLYASPVDIMIGSSGYGMGGAYVALANDPSAAYWNPAGLSQVDEISIMESNWIFQSVDDINVNYLTAAIPLKHVGTISGSWLLTHATLEEGWDYTTNKPKNSESANEHAFSLSVGRQLWDKLWIFEKTSLGFSINRHTFTTDAGNGAGLGFDLGFLTYFPNNISIGFTARSLGTDVMGYKIDPEFRLGIGYSLLIQDMHRITAAVDGSFKRNRDYSSESKLQPARRNQKAHGGLEYAILFNDFEIALRGGGNARRHNSIDTYHFAFGAGFKFRSYSLQYAFNGDTYADVSLGYGHRISIIVGLNDLIKKSDNSSNKRSREDRPLQEEPVEEETTLDESPPEPTEDDSIDSNLFEDDSSEEGVDSEKDWEF